MEAHLTASETTLGARNARACFGGGCGGEERWGSAADSQGRPAPPAEEVSRVHGAHARRLELSVSKSIPHP